MSRWRRGAGGREAGWRHLLPTPRRPPRHWPRVCWPRCPGNWWNTTATRSCLQETSAPTPEKPAWALLSEDPWGGQDCVHCLPPVSFTQLPRGLPSCSPGPPSAPVTLMPGGLKGEEVPWARLTLPQPGGWGGAWGTTPLLLIFTGESQQTVPCLLRKPRSPRHLSLQPDSSWSQMHPPLSLCLWGLRGWGRGLRQNKVSCPCRGFVPSLLPPTAAEDCTPLEGWGLVFLYPGALH